MNQSIWPESQYLDLTTDKDSGIEFYFSASYSLLIKEYGKTSVEKFLSNVAKKGYLLIYYTEESSHKEASFSVLASDPDKNIDDLVFIVELSKDSQFDGSDEKKDKRLIIKHYTKFQLNTGRYLAESGVYVKCNNIKFSYVATGNKVTSFGTTFKTTYNPVDIFKIIETKRKHLVPKRDNKQLSKKWSKILDYAKYFTNIEDNIERTDLVSNTKINYSSYSSIIQEKNEDIAYKFLVDNINKEYEVGRRIDINDEFETLHHPVRGTILEINKEEKYIIITFPNQVSLESIPLRGVISLAYANIQSRVRLNVVQNLKELKAGNYLNDIFENVGKCLPFQENIDLTELENKWKNMQREVDRIKSLPKEQQANYKVEYPPTPTQQEAIKNGIKAKDLYLVWGPPGTGKTTVIKEWVEYFARQGKRVLISSQNNKAVDNVLERLPEDIKKNSIRIGNQEKIQLNVQDYSYQQRVSNLGKDLVSNVLKNEKLFKEKLELVKEKYQILKKYNDIFTKKFSSYKIETYNKKINLFKENVHVLDNLYREYVYYYTKIGGTINGCPNKKIIKFIVKLSLTKDYLRMHKVVSKYNMYSKYLLNYEKEFVCSYLDKFILANPLPEDLLEVRYKHRDNDYSYILFVKDYLNKAVSNCEKSIDDLNVLIKSNEEWKSELNNRNDAITSDIILSTTQVVGATCIGISTRRIFQNIEFDVSIIDESGQIQLHNALVPLSRSNKAIMLGDHKQIPQVQIKMLWL